MSDRSGYSFTITEFCKAERISRASYYKMRREGRGPEVILIGADQRITAAARERWHRRMEAEAKAAARRCA